MAGPKWPTRPHVQYYTQWPRAHVDVVADMLAGQFPSVAELLLDAKADLTAYAAPHAHWRKIWSTNPLERVTTSALARR